MNYTIIAHRCSWTDSVMGCIQDRGDSELEINTYYSIEDAAQAYARYATAEPYSKYVQNEWELTVLFNGEDPEMFVYDENNGYAIIPENQQIIDAFDELHRSSVKDIIAEKAAEEKRKAEARAITAQIKKELAEKKKRQNELHQLAILKKKYET